jgi:hypothetical protein
MFMIIQYKTKHRLDKKDWGQRYPIDQICDDVPPFHTLFFVDKETAWKQLEEWGIEKEMAELQNIEIVGVH